MAKGEVCIFILVQLLSRKERPVSIEIREQTNYRFLLLPHGISGIKFLEKSPMQLYVLNFRGKMEFITV